MVERYVTGWRRFLGPFGPRPRLTASIAVGLVVGVGCALFAKEMRPSTWLILGWDSLSFAFLGSMFLSWFRHDAADKLELRMIGVCNPNSSFTRRRLASR